MLKFKEFETLASNQDNRGSLDTKNLLNDMLNVQMNQNHLYPLQMFQTPAATIGGGFGAKKNVKITNCIHTTARHYSKGMCNNCYHNYGRTIRATDCPHPSRPNYAKNKCK